MSFLGKLIRTGLDIIVDVPVAVVKDVATMAGATTDQPEPYTVKAVKKTASDAGAVRDELENL